MATYKSVLGDFINFLNSLQPRRRSRRQIVEDWRKAQERRSMRSGKDEKADIKNSVRQSYPNIDEQTLKLVDNLIESSDIGEIRITGELRLYRKQDEYNELTKALLLDMEVSNLLDDGVSSFQAVLHGIRDMEEDEWFVLEFSASDESRAMSIQPPNETLNMLLESITEAVRCKRSDFKIIQISSELNPDTLKSNTIVVNNFDEFNVSGEGKILEYLRSMQGLGMAKVVDNFKKAELSDEKKNIIVFGLTKCRKSGTANDIIKMLDPHAPDMVFFEQAALSHTSKVRFFEVGDVRVWDTPGLDDQRGRQEHFIKKLYRLIEAVPKISAMYLCVKDAGDLNPNGMQPIRDIVDYLPQSSRGRVSMLLTRTSPTIGHADRNSVKLNAEKASLPRDVVVIQATRDAQDYNLNTKVQEDLEKEPLPFGYITRILETLDEVERKQPVLNTLVAFEVKRSMERLEELIKNRSTLRSTRGVVCSLHKHEIQIKSYNKPLSKANSRPWNAKVEFEIFLKMNKRIGWAELIVDAVDRLGSYEMLTRYLSSKSLLVFDDVLDTASGEAAFNSAQQFSFLLIPMTDVLSERLKEDVSKAARYTN